MLSKADGALLEKKGSENIGAVYDEAGLWLGDYDNTGAPVQQAVWMDDLPVGLMTRAKRGQRTILFEFLGSFGGRPGPLTPAGRLSDFSTIA